MKIKGEIGRNFKTTITIECENMTKHTPCPSGYVDWHNWAEKKSKTHKQIRCPVCDTLAIWVPKKRQPDSERGE